MTILEQMTTADLEALATKLHGQIDPGPNGSEIPKVGLEDVKSWIALHKKEAQLGSELSFLMNLL